MGLTRRAVSSDIQVAGSLVLRLVVVVTDDGGVAEISLSYGTGAGDEWRRLPGHRGMHLDRTAVEALGRTADPDRPLDALQNLLGIDLEAIHG